MSMLDSLLATIAPHYCLGCEAEGTLLCADCSRGAASPVSRCYRCGRITQDYRTCPSCRRASGLFQVWVAHHYDGIVKDVVHRLKFERAEAAAGDMARLLAGRFAFGDVLITHVPTAPERARQRGYDQAALIAKALAKCVGMPYAPLLARVGNQRQVGQTGLTRRQQMRTAFRVIHPQLLQGSILLVDDVLTTGSTCEAAAQILRQAGAPRISAAIFAAV